MSGKFHTTWGEFGGFKHPDAIRYEASAMIANGVACNFGDQLHPSGEMDSATYVQYCSHQNTPYQLQDAPHAGAVQKGRVVFLPHRLGKLYSEYGARLHRDLFGNALRRIYQHPMVRTTLPSAGRITLLHQPEQQRYVVHLLYAPPLQRGRCQVIEDLPELRNVPVTLRAQEKIKRAYLIPDKKRLSLNRSDGSVRAVVPAFTSHCAVVFKY